MWSVYENYEGIDIAVRLLNTHKQERTGCILGPKSYLITRVLCLLGMSHVCMCLHSVNPMTPELRHNTACVTTRANLEIWVSKVESKMPYKVSLKSVIEQAKRMHTTVLRHVHWDS